MHYSVMYRIPSTRQTLGKAFLLPVNRSYKWHTGIPGIS